jgi:hypothetical protein
MLKNRNNQPHSFKQRMEQVYRKHKIVRKNYHGGKFDGVMCQKIMEEAKALIDDLKRLLLDLREQGGDFTVSAESVETKCDTFENLLGQLDAVFSMAKSIDGLLPTEEYINQLERAVKAARASWPAMGLTTNQPKWHLTFDGHFVHQVQKYGGLADKSDEFIEKGHQEWIKLKRRFARIADFKQVETCIMRAWRRSRHPEVRAHVALVVGKRKQKHGGKDSGLGSSNAEAFQ